jgi:2-aminoadipate transaminase
VNEDNGDFAGSSALPTIQFQPQENVIDLAWGHPAAELLPVNAWQAACAAAAEKFGWQALTYGHPSGPGVLTEWLGEHLGRSDGRRPHVLELFVTPGSSAALDLVSSCLTRPGDVVIVDSPTYHLGLKVLRDRAAELVPAATENGTLDPAGTARLIRHLIKDGRHVAMLYVVPTFSNPSGQTLSAERRLAVADLAAATGVTVVEDDPYHELWYDVQPPPSIWSLGPDAPVIRLGSFSKTVAPGIRLGWLTANRRMVETLKGRGIVRSGGGMNHANALAMAMFCSSAMYASHLTLLRNAYRDRRDTLAAALREHLQDVDFAVPQGGWYLWLKLSDDLASEELVKHAKASGVHFLLGKEFYINGSAENRIRLAYSRCSLSELDEAGHRLMLAVQSARRH